MASVKIVFRPSARAGRCAGSLFLRIIHHRKSKTLSLSCRLFPDEWDAASETVLYPSDAPGRRAYLEECAVQLTCRSGHARDIIDELERQGTYSAKDVVARLRTVAGKGGVTSYAGALFSEFQQSGQYRTASAYRTVARTLTAFNKGTDVLLRDIDAGLVRRFEIYLKMCGKRPNTVSFYMRNLRALCNRAAKAGLIPAGRTVSLFADVFTGVEETRKRALGANDVNRLMNIDFDRLLAKDAPGTPAHRQVCGLFRTWRLFFFCLYAQGMCFVDMCYLQKSNLRGNVLRYYRRKTGRPVEVPVNEEMSRIIGSFAEQVKDSEYLFPMLAGTTDMHAARMAYETALRTQNRRLKKLAKLADLGKEVSTHVARHSWATICKNELLPVSVISEGLGHSSEKMTRRYLASFDHSVLNDAARAVLTAVSRTPQGANIVPGL